MKSTLLLTKKATRANVLAAMRAAAKTLQAGDLLFLTYSGHGGQVPDVTGEEDDKQDETWCLYDGQLIDDELYLELSRFAAGVRILVLSDSCHSGTVTRATAFRDGSPAGRSKMMPPPSRCGPIASIRPSTTSCSATSPRPRERRPCRRPTAHWRTLP